MLFYKCSAGLDESGAAADKKRKDPADRPAKFISYSDMMFEQHKKKIFCFAADISGGIIKIGVIAENVIAAPDMDALVKEYCGMAGLTVSGKIKREELTIGEIESLTNLAWQNDFSRMTCDIMEKFRITELFNNWLIFDEYRKTEYTESKEKLRERAEVLLCDESMGPELDRIFTETKHKPQKGIPVHYMIRSEDTEVLEGMNDILAGALEAADRVYNKRHCIVHLTGRDRLHGDPLHALEELYEAYRGGIVGLHYTAENENSGAYSRAGLDVLDRMCDTMQKYRDDVTTVFLLDPRSKNTRDAVMERMSDSTIVEIDEQTVSGGRAEAYLKELCRAHGVRAYADLLRKPAAGRSYRASELNAIFAEWYAKELKTRYYPQYREIGTARSTAAAVKVKGNAYSRLQEMTGLEEAKKLIGKALDYYKVQRLFKDKGIARNDPAMHMVFTGNPGTAKTTVARLFANIMKDNGLLRYGDLYEVGRADLVGRYVGWTAQIVKEKFAAARGGVLFIDEAYALVEDNNGMYGDEAINTIVQEMENKRDDIVVIFAGYPDKMETLLQRNPGLRSRIAFHVRFDDYDPQELFEIVGHMAAAEHITLAAGVREKIIPVFREAIRAEDFGNGRFARNVYERALMDQASRIVKMDAVGVTEEDLKTLLPEDFDLAAMRQKSTARRIGFTE